jgi:hypothetical protein
VNTSVGGDLAVLGVLGYLGLIGAAGVAGSSGRREVGRAGGASDGDIKGRLLSGGVKVAEEAVDDLLAEGLKDGVLFKKLDALGLKVVGERAVGNGVVAFEGAAGGALEAVCGGEKGGGDRAARGEGGAGGGTGSAGKDAEGGEEAEAVPKVVEVLLVGDADGIIGADGVEEDTCAIL